MARIVWTAEAAHCLEAIHGYIAGSSPRGAFEVASQIYEKVQLLGSHPRLGVQLPQFTDREVRETLSGWYRIPYEVTKDGTVVILGVFHGAMEIERLQS